MKNIFFTLTFRIVGIITLILGFRMIGEGICNYINENDQKDWIATYATITDIQSKYSDFPSDRYNDLSYDITYQYEVKGKVYSDILYNRSKPLLLGNSVKIKYDSDAPENSTDILVPSFNNLVVFLVVGSMMSIIGFFISGLWALIHKIRRRGMPEEEEVLPPEEYVKPEKNVKKFGKSIIHRIIVFAIVCGSIISFGKLFPAPYIGNAEQFKNIVEKEGYMTIDTTDELSQEWKVGSMLKEAVSINDGNIRMDYCEMDTVDSASILYSGMTFSFSEGEKNEYGDINYKFYSIENIDCYTAKIRYRDTVIYVSAKSEYKAQVVGLLKAIRYWKE